MNAFLLIVIGIVVGGWAAHAGTLVEQQRPAVLQGPLGSLIQFICQFGGLGLLIYGIVKLFF